MRIHGFRSFDIFCGQKPFSGMISLSRTTCYYGKVLGSSLNPKINLDRLRAQSLEYSVVCFWFRVSVVGFGFSLEPAIVSTASTKSYFGNHRAKAREKLFFSSVIEVSETRPTGDDTKDCFEGLSVQGLRGPEFRVYGLPRDPQTPFCEENTLHHIGAPTIA